MSSRLHVSQKYAEECCDNINSERRVASLALLDGRFSSALQSLSKTSPHYKNWQAAVCHVFAGRADEVNLYLSRTNWSCLVPAHVPLSGPVRYERVGWAHTPESRKVQNNLGEREGVSESFLGSIDGPSPRRRNCRVKRVSVSKRKETNISLWPPNDRYIYFCPSPAPDDDATLCKIEFRAREQNGWELAASQTP